MRYLNLHVPTCRCIQEFENMKVNTPHACMHMARTLRVRTFGRSLSRHVKVNAVARHCIEECMHNCRVNIDMQQQRSSRYNQVMQ
jgi:hypothetical protein